MHSNTVIVLQLHETQRKRDGKMEEVEERERQRQRKRELPWEVGKVRGEREREREAVWTMSSILHRKWNKQ